MESENRSTCSCHAGGTRNPASFSRARRASLSAPSTRACFARANRQYVLEMPCGASSFMSQASR
eukprot:scaffold305097_cov24-Tisochrysis_lutea.AAC.1